MHIVITDLDATLLDHDTYEWHPAAGELERLRMLGVPVVFTTSKTRAEVEHWRAVMRNTDPFIVENGGAIFIPHGYFPFPPDGALPDHQYQRIELGAPYAELVKILADAAAEAGCRVEGFAQLSTEEIAHRTQLSLPMARLAKLREYDEAFELLSGDARALAEAIGQRGLRFTRGGRFFHIMGASDKGEAVRRLLALYRRQYDGLHSIGLGDNRNDLAFLAVVDSPVIIRSSAAPELARALPHALMTQAPGPSGWAEAIHILVR